MRRTGLRWGLRIARWPVWSSWRHCRSPASRARRTASGRPTAATSANTRYSPLDQINAANFNKLEIAWRFKTDSLGPRPEFNFEVDAADGRTASSTRPPARAAPSSRSTRRPASMLWMHSEHEGARGAAAPRQLSGRGLAYWTDGREERILYVTPGYRLIALDAKTGVPVAGFGKNGVVDLKQDDDQEIDLVTGEIGLHADADRRRKTSIIVGAAHLTGGVPKSKTNVKGYVRGFDVRTGKRLWIFHTIPRPGEFGNDTWEKDSWSYTGNAGVVGADVGRRRARHGLPAGRAADRRLLRRPSSRQRPVRREPRRASI